MKTKYLSLAQACAISKEYQYLKGALFREHHKVDLITVAPYSRILRWQFLDRHINRGQSIPTLLEGSFDGRYDVVAVTRIDDDPGFLVVDLRSLLQEQNISFDPSRYNCLRNRSIPPVMLRRLSG